MKKLAISILFILVGLFIIDRAGGMAMWWVNQHTKDVTGPKMRYLIDDFHEDVLLMGTSRCNSHYVPSIISDTLGMSVYNGGIDGSKNIFSHYIMLCHILASHTPKVICLEVQQSDFDKERDPFTCITFFAPYFGKNAQADSVFRLAGKYWPYRISHLYRFNAKATSNLAGLVVSRLDNSNNGYVPYAPPAHFPNTLNYKNTSEDVDSLKLEYVQKFINLCKEKEVRLIFTISPMYAKIDSDYYKCIENIARKNDIPILNYHTAGLYQDHPDYFHDSNHLWDKGARLYSSVFAGDLKIIIGKENKTISED